MRRITKHPILGFCVFTLLNCFSVSAQDERISAILNQFESDFLTLEVRRLSGEIPVTVNGSSVVIESRLYNKPGNTYAFQYLQQKLVSYGLNINTQAFSTNGRNLFGIKYGSISPEKVCMIGAHYDNVPTGDIAPGADDNASGCAAVLEAARLFAETDFPNTVIFAFWDEEELGLIGSTAYAESGVHGTEFLGYLNLDMIGWDGNGDMLTEIHTRPIGNSVELANSVILCNELYNIGLAIELLNPGSVNTDHFSFWQNGYTAVGINEEYEGDVNPHYHSITDQFQYLDTAYMTANAKLSIAALATLAFRKTIAENPAETAANVSIYPNPATDLLNLKFAEVIGEEFSVIVTDQRGKKISETTASSTDFISLSLRNFSAGLYLLTLKGADFSYTFSIAKY